MNASTLHHNHDMRLTLPAFSRPASPAAATPARRAPLQAACALAVLLHAAGAQAQAGLDEPGPGPGANPTQQLREVVVSGRRSLSERFMATGSLVVVDRQDIELMGVDSAVDVLRQLPGVQVNTGASGNVEIRMRGLDSSATRVLIDGQRAAGRSQLPVDQLPADLIERIEVVRSPSAEFSGTSGGTINIVLRQANPQRSTNIRLTDVITWGEHRGRLWASRSGPLGQAEEGRPGPNWSYFSGVWLADQLTGSDLEREQSTGGGPAQRTDIQTRLDRRDVWLVQRLNGRIGRDQLALRGSLSGSEGRGEVETRSTTGTQTDTSTQQRQAWQLGSDWTRRLSIGKLESSLSGNNQTDEQRRQGLSRFSEDRRESTWQLKSKLTGARESLLWMTGFDYETRNARGLSQLDANAPENLRSGIDRVALWGQNEWALPRKTTLTLGLRAESLLLRSEVDGGGTSSVRQRLDIWQPSLHARTPAGENAQWRLNLARITRQPNVADLLDRTVPSQGSNSINNADTLGNPNLRPEVTQTLDVGYEQRLSGGGQAGLGLFVRQTDDVVATQVFQLNPANPSDRWLEQRQNIGSARTLGLEADVKRPLSDTGWGRAWMLSATGTLLDAELTSGPRQGQSIPGLSRYSASFSLAKPMRRGGGYFGGASLTLSGPSVLNTSVTTGQERSRATLDLHVGQSVSRTTSWRVGIYNLGDTPLRRSRQYTSGGQSVTEASSTSFATRIFASVGVQF